jgi:hypothetical protein
VVRVSRANAKVRLRVSRREAEAKPAGTADWAILPVWEREWLIQAFGDEFVQRLEPGVGRFFFSSLIPTQD